jgi:hypothetical protein
MKKVILFVSSAIVLIGGMSLNQKSSFQIEKYKAGMHKNSAGSPTGQTGAPGESNCTSCHSGTVQSGATENALTVAKDKIVAKFGRIDALVNAGKARGPDPDIIILPDSIVFPNKVLFPVWVVEPVIVKLPVTIWLPIKVLEPVVANIDEPVLFRHQRHWS